MRPGVGAPAYRGGMLNVRQHMLLRFEERRFKYAGAKETQIRDLFGVSATRYYAELGGLLGRPEALAAYPATVRRLVRVAGGTDGVAVAGQWLTHNYTNTILG